MLSLFVQSSFGEWSPRKGGLTIASAHQIWNAVTPLQLAAFFDPRAQAQAVAAINQVFADGADLPSQFGTSGQYYAITDNTYDANPPVAQAYRQATNALPVPPNVGIRLPTAVGQSVTFPDHKSPSVDYLGISPNPVESYELLVSRPGTYSVTLYGEEEGPTAS